MKQLKKLVAGCTAGFMLCFTGFAFAQEEARIPENEQKNEQTMERTIVLDEDIDPNSKKLTPGQAKEEAPMEKAASDVTQDINKELQGADYAEMDMVVNPNTRAYNAYYQSLTGAIATEGTIQPYGVIVLAPNQILQVGLECPKHVDMDYDLYIAEVMDDGTVGNILAGSMYATHIEGGMTKTLDEGIDYINTSTTNKRYAILVHAKKGGGEMFPYTLYYSIDAQGNYNPNENDQNAATPMATLPFGYLINNVALNSPADVDWIAIDNSMGNAFEHADIALSITDVTTGAAITTDSVELYKHVGDNKMLLLEPRTDGTYRFTPSSNTGEYFIRIAPKDRDNMDWHQYKISVDIAATQTAAANLHLVYTTPEDPSGTNYVTWPQYGNAYCLNTYTWFQVEGTVTDAFGDPVPNYGTASVLFTNFYWRDIGKNENLATASGRNPVNANGKFTIRINDFPSPAGYYSYRSASGYTHRYDLAQLEVSLGSFYHIEPIYHWSYAM